jgi:hypothetical protein
VSRCGQGIRRHFNETVTTLLACLVYLIGSANYASLVEDIRFLKPLSCVIGIIIGKVIKLGAFQSIKKVGDKEPVKFENPHTVASGLVKTSNRR